MRADLQQEKEEKAGLISLIRELQVGQVALSLSTGTPLLKNKLTLLPPLMAENSQLVKKAAFDRAETKKVCKNAFYGLPRS